MAESRGLGDVYKRQDQLQAVLELCRGIPALRDVVPSPYDGDTPQESRAGVRDHSRFIFSNPDMVHMSLLAAHARAGFLRRIAVIGRGHYVLERRNSPAQLEHGLQLVRAQRLGGGEIERAGGWLLR